MKKEESNQDDPFSASLTVPATLYSLEPLSQHLHFFLRCCTISLIPLRSETVYALDVAVGEVVTNIIRHGLPHCTDQSIEMHLSCSPWQVQIEILDRGKPIPMALLQQRSVHEWQAFWQPERPESWPEKGLGLRLIYSMVDKVLYRSEPQLNRLTLIKYLIR